MSRACCFDEEPERMGCAACGKLQYEPTMRPAGPNDELVCSDACAEIVTHEHCGDHPCNECMERAQEKRDARCER